eukprot:scaffold9159_cov44-Phaeocystis_antarctica.AAC.2
MQSRNISMYRRSHFWWHVSLPLGFGTYCISNPNPNTNYNPNPNPNPDPNPDPNPNPNPNPDPNPNPNQAPTAYTAGWTARCADSGQL